MNQMDLSRARGPIAMAVASALACSEALGQSSVPQVTAGSATVQRSSPDATTVHQHSDRAVLDWNSLSLAAGQSLEFLQPSASSAVLNRVRAGSPSVIDGLLRANGTVFVVNPSGVLVGPNGSIDVGGFLATTSQIATGDFMAGRLAFAPSAESVGTVMNQGLISIADGGFAALVAPHVGNSGVIQAHGGRVVLSGQPYFTVDLYGDQLISFGMPADAGVPGRLLLTANGVSDVVEGAINLDGVRNADTITRSGDDIVLSSGRIDVDGVIDTSSASGKGGSIDLLASQVSITSSGRLDSRGATAGGDIHVGGDERGTGARPRAMRVDVAEGALIDASGVGQGSAGKVVLWSDGNTSLRGLVRATGGAHGGHGGFVEISGKQSLEVLGDVLNGAPAGRPGTILLDPRDLFVAEPGQRSNVAAVVSAAFINEQLRRGIPVELVADRSITVMTPIDGLGSGVEGGAISLSADSILLLAPVITNNGAITITANDGSIQFEANAYLLVGSSDPDSDGIGNADIVLTATGENLSVGHVATLGTILVNAQAGSVEFAHALAGLAVGDPLDPTSTGVGDLDVRAGGDVTLRGGEFASVSADSSGGRIINLANTLIATQGGVMLRASGGLELGGDAEAEVAIDVRSSDGNAILMTSQVTQLQGSVRTAGGDIALVGLNGGRQASIQTGDGIVLQAGDEAGDAGGIQLMSAGDIDVGNLVTGTSGEIVAGSQTGTVNLRAPISGFAIADAGAGEDAAHGIGALIVRSGSAGNDAVRIGDVVTNAPDGVQVSTSGRVLLSGDVIARNGEITIGAVDESALAPLSIDALGVLQTVGAEGGIGGPITLSSRGDIHTADLIAGPGAVVAVTAAEGSVTTQRISGVGGTAVDRVLLQAGGGSLQVGAIASRQDVQLRAAENVTLLGNVVAEGPAEGGLTIDIDAGGSVTGSDAEPAVRLRAGNDSTDSADIRIIAGSDVRLDALIAGSGADVTVDSATGDVIIGKAVTGMVTDSGAGGVASLTINAGGIVSLPGALAVGNAGGVSITAGGTGESITIGVDQSNELYASNVGLVAYGTEGIFLQAAGDIVVNRVPSVPVGEDSSADVAALVTQNGPVRITSTGGNVSLLDDASSGAGSITADAIAIEAHGDMHVEDLRVGSVASVRLVSTGPGGNIRMNRPLLGQPELPAESEFAGIGSLRASAGGDIYFSGAQVEGSGATLSAGGHLRMRGPLYSRGSVTLGNPAATGYIHLDDHIYTFGQSVTFRNDVRVLENLVWSETGALVFRDYLADGTYIEVPIGESLTIVATQFDLGGENAANSCNEGGIESGSCIGQRADLLATRLCADRYACESVLHEEYESILLLNSDRARLLFSHDAFYRLDENGVATTLLARGVDYNTGFENFNSSSPELDIDRRVEEEQLAAEQRVNFLSRLLSPVTVTIQTDTQGSSGAAVLFEDGAALLRSNYADVFGVSTTGDVLYPSITIAQGARPGLNCSGCDFLYSKNLDVPLSYVNSALHLSLGGIALDYAGEVGSATSFDASMSGTGAGFPVLGSFSISDNGLAVEQLTWVNDSSIAAKRPTIPQFSYAGTQYSPRSSEGASTDYRPPAGGLLFASNVFTSVGSTSGSGSASLASGGAEFISTGSGGSGANPSAVSITVDNGDAESADRATAGESDQDVPGNEEVQVNPCPRGASRSADVGTASPQDGAAPNVFSLCAPDLSPPPTLGTVAVR